MFNPCCCGCRPLTEDFAGGSIPGDWLQSSAGAWTVSVGKATCSTADALLAAKIAATNINPPNLTTRLYSGAMEFDVGATGVATFGFGTVDAGNEIRLDVPNGRVGAFTRLAGGGLTERSRGTLAGAGPWRARVEPAVDSHARFYLDATHLCNLNWDCAATVGGDANAWLYWAPRAGTMTVDNVAIDGCTLQTPACGGYWFPDDRTEITVTINAWSAPPVDPCAPAGGLLGTYVLTHQPAGWWAAQFNGPNRCRFQSAALSPLRCGVKYLIADFRWTSQLGVPYSPYAEMFLYFLDANEDVVRTGYRHYRYDGYDAARDLLLDAGSAHNPRIGSPWSTLLACNSGHPTFTEGTIDVTVAL